MLSALDAFLAEHPLTDSVDLLIPDLCGILRGKRLPPSAIRAALAGEAFFTSSVYALDSTGANCDRSGLVWEEGDADRPLRVDPASLRPVPWRPGGAQIMGGLGEEAGGPFFADCRAIVARLARRLKELGLTPVAALELEFYLLDAANDAAGAPQLALCERLGRRPVETEVFAPERMEDQEAFFELVDRYATTQDLPVKGALCEFAAGQYEINLGHGDDMLLAADQGALLKRCVKAAARATGQRATFMAKPFTGESGSGLHIHLSLYDREGRNLFGETEAGEALLRHAVWGLQATMAESMLILAPNANSYRRLLPRSYAPTSASWGINNRTVALRIPPGPAKARRIEHRVAGSDANPYLVLACVLAGVLHGLEHAGDPGPPITGNAYEAGLPLLPLTWEAAIAASRQASILPTYLGERYWQLYTACREAERDRFHVRTTPTEYEWYLTSI